MSVLLVLIPLSLLLVAVAVLAFFWAAGSGQFDNLDTEAWRVVMDDETQPPESRRQPREEKDDAS